MNIYKNILISLVIFSGVFAVGFQAEALIVNGYDPAVHDRFIPGTYSSNPVSNPNFFAASYDWSGVGWETWAPSRSVAMISPLHFVGANHWRIPVGNSVTFYNQLGDLKSYTVEGYSTFDEEWTNDEGESWINTPDLTVGRLSGVISEMDKISHYKVLDASDYSTEWCDARWYEGKEVYAYGTSARAGTNVIDFLQNVCTSMAGPLKPINLTTTAVYDTHATGDYYGEAGGQGGDSGSPSFIPYNGELTLMGTHFAISGDTSGTWRTYDSAIPGYLDNIDAAMISYGYKVERIYIDIFPSKLENKDFDMLWSGFFRNEELPKWDVQSQVDGPMFTYTCHSTEYVKSGERSIYYMENIDPVEGAYGHDEYVYQTVEGAKVGQEYAFSFWYLNAIGIAPEMLIDTAQLKIMAGIDPTGGTNPDSANIIWEIFLLNPDDFNTSWHRMMVSTTAIDSAMTFFIGRELFTNISAADAAAGKYWVATTYFDNSEIYCIPEPSTLILFGLSLVCLLGWRKQINRQRNKN